MMGFLKIVSNKNLLFQGSIFRCHVNSRMSNIFMKSTRSSATFFVSFKVSLGGNFKQFFFSTLPGEMKTFSYRIFFKQPPTRSF